MAKNLGDVLDLYLDSAPTPAAPTQGPNAQSRAAGPARVLAIPTGPSDLVEPALLSWLAMSLREHDLRVLIVAPPAPKPWADLAGFDFVLAPFSAEGLCPETARELLPPLDRTLLWTPTHPSALERTAARLRALARLRPGARADLVFLGSGGGAQAATSFRRLAAAREETLTLRHAGVLPGGPWLARSLLHGPDDRAPGAMGEIARALAAA